MSKNQYILRSLSKISHKPWEHYVINRIFHRLNDPEIEFVCQQCVRKEDGKFYLADLYFPQFDLYLEIDEAHHDSDNAKIDDAKRRFDIAEAAQLEEARISTSGRSMEYVDAEVEKFVSLLRGKKERAKNPFGIDDKLFEFTQQSQSDETYLKFVYELNKHNDAFKEEKEDTTQSP